MSDMEKLNGANFSLWRAQIKDILILKDQYFPFQYNYQSIFPLLNLFWMIKIRAILLMCFMIENWENSIVAMTTSSPTGTLNLMMLVVV